MPKDVGPKRDDLGFIPSTKIWVGTTMDVRVEMRGTTYAIVYQSREKGDRVIAVCYDETHAREMRKMFRRMYGLDPYTASSKDVLLYQGAAKVDHPANVVAINRKSSNPVVAAHANMSPEAAAQKWAEDLLASMK